ncbi:transmembrane 53-B [Fusarium tjaetaba]|uniref:Transmembrane 53-B n=1 Tax=Fusarium tjaetaba TaxID=1567544 RepID=A0A8H5QSR3_9HYPO|nr:transmembrane 53-B [Fusarium tjaetaba]KAF5622255.1 transmembrane 53-B [Fusarium tjaetaba]
MSVQAKSLSYMEKLSNEVFVYRPSKPTAPDSPKIIIIASWTNALDSHIAKYVDKHKELYPTSQLVLVKSYNKNFFDPKALAESPRPAVPVIRASFPSAPPSTAKPEIMIHLFSNGGSSNISSLYDAYAATAQEGEDPWLPPHVTVFDSAPGAQRLTNTAAFFKSTIPKSYRLVCMPFVYGVAAAWQVGWFLGLTKDWLAFWGSTHNTAQGKREREIRRTYIYSEGDELIDYRDLEAQAAEAEKMGFDVHMEKFDGSLHVAHARKDEARYWSAVQKTWSGFE